MRIREGYKQTELGVVPEDWALNPISAVAETSSGTTPARALAERYYRNGTTPWVKTLDLKVQAGRFEDAPAQLNTPGRLALYNNLKAYVVSNMVSEPAPAYGTTDPMLDLALRLDETVKRRRPDGWRGVATREQLIKQALYEVLKDIDQVHRIYPVIFAQREY